MQWDVQLKENMSTAFARLKNTWFSIAPYAKIVNPAVCIEWEQDGQAFTFTNNQCLTPRRLALSTIIDMASDFSAQVQESLDSLLPPGFSRSLFDIHNLKDDLTGTPIFEQEANFTILKSIIDDLHHAVLKDGVRMQDRRKVQYFLKKEQEFLDVLLVAIVLTIGIPPQAAQFAEIRWASLDGKHCRNIFLLNKEILLALSQRRVNSRIYPALVWAFPPEVGDALAFYVCIVRPAAIKLIETVGEKPHCDRFTHLFIVNCASRRGTHAWDGRKISTTIENATKEHTQLRLTLTHLYCIMKEIYKHHFPFITISQHVRSSTTIANSQGGHTQLTSDFHYGLSKSLPSGISMSNAFFSFFVEKSKAWHGVIGARPSHWSLSESMRKISSMKHRCNLSAALHSARWLVCRFYDFSGTLDGHATRVRAVEILHTKSYLKFPFDMVSIECSFNFLSDIHIVKEQYSI